MNLFDSSFLCLDIGSSSVKAIAHRVRSGRLTNSAMHSVESFDTIFAIKSVVDELEKQIGTHFDSAFITGNFGTAEFEMIARNTTWGGEHKITFTDVQNQISKIPRRDGFYPMHIIPLRYDAPMARNMMTPVGHTDRQLTSIFGTVFYEERRLSDIFAFLRRAHIKADAYFDPSFLQDDIFREKKQPTIFIDFGAEFTTASVWTDRGPVFFKKIAMGQTAITHAIASELDISFDDAEKIKRMVASVQSKEMDRFTPADTVYDFSRADLNDIILPALLDIIAQIKESLSESIGKYNPTKIFLSGGGALIDGIGELIENTFGLPVDNIGSDAGIRALAASVWRAQDGHVKTYMTRRTKWKNVFAHIAEFFKRPKKKSRHLAPIMPSTLAFDMKNPTTYNLFRSGNISRIHVDIMDGFFVDRITGGIDELKYIREHTNAHLNVHLMTESPVVWAAAAAAAGADTIIVSTNTAGVRAALQKIKEHGKRCGVALGLESSVGILKPVLRDLDEILIMAVKTGSGNQKFDTSVLAKISVLAAARKRYGLKFKISVDGGINPNTAQLCWDAGADFLVSGSYLARAPDFPMAVISLLRKD